MKKLFLETTEFSREVIARLDDQAYAAFQNQLMANPEEGKVMPGCGKARLADPKRRKGKRGGARVIYLHVPRQTGFFCWTFTTKANRTT